MKLMELMRKSLVFSNLAAREKTAALREMIEWLRGDPFSKAYR